LRKTDHFSPLEFYINSIHSRIEKKGDLWYNFLDEKIAVEKAQILQMFLHHD